MAARPKLCPPAKVRPAFTVCLVDDTDLDPLGPPPAPPTTSRGDDIGKDARARAMAKKCAGSTPSARAVLVPRPPPLPRPPPPPARDEPARDGEDLRLKSCLRWRRTALVATTSQNQRMRAQSCQLRLGLARRRRRSLARRRRSVAGRRRR